MRNKGIDVSNHQGDINWSEVKVDYAIIKAGYGREISQKDERFEANYRGAKAANIPVGAYWYSYATTPAEAITEANVCIEVLKGKTFEYPIYFDIEENRQFATGTANCSEMVMAFCKTLEAAGYFAGIYSSKSQLDSYLTKDVRKRYTVWVAQYNRECTYSLPYGMWQYAVVGSKWDTYGEGHISGINGNCDVDYCFIDFPDIIRKSGLNGFPKVTAASKAETEHAPAAQPDVNQP
ncbi:MAG: glycoside hydrolase family 25 protein [Oscillospiraceae bacterium]|nr:glycoside hydrolase family 25 protein [Oscillospiraceae bacterium]